MCRYLTTNELIYDRMNALFNTATRFQTSLYMLPSTDLSSSNLFKIPKKIQLEL